MILNPSQNNSSNIKKDTGKKNDQATEKIEHLERAIRSFLRCLPYKLDGTNYPIWYSFLYDYFLILGHDITVQQPQNLALDPMLVTSLILLSVEPQVARKLEKTRYAIPCKLTSHLKLICDSWDATVPKSIAGDNSKPQTEPKKPMSVNNPTCCPTKHCNEVADMGSLRVSRLSLKKLNSFSDLFAGVIVILVLVFLVSHWTVERRLAGMIVSQATSPNLTN